MVWVVDVHNDLFGLPVTSGAVGVLEGRQCAPGDVLIFIYMNAAVLKKLTFSSSKRIALNFR